MAGGNTGSSLVHWGQVGLNSATRVLYLELASFLIATSDWPSDEPRFMVIVVLKAGNHSKMRDKTCLLRNNAEIIAIVEAGTHNISLYGCYTLQKKYSVSVLSNFEDKKKNNNNNGDTERRKLFLALSLYNYRHVMKDWHQWKKAYFNWCVEPDEITILHDLRHWDKCLWKLTSCWIQHWSLSKQRPAMYAMSMLSGKVALTTDFAYNQYKKASFISRTILIKYIFLEIFSFRVLKLSSKPFLTNTCFTNFNLVLWNLIGRKNK